MRSEILDCRGALETLASTAGSGLILRRDAAVPAALRGFRGGWSFLSGLASLFLRGFFSLGGGCGCDRLVEVWLVLPIVGVADVSRCAVAASSKPRYGPTRMVEFGASPAG